MATLTNTKIKDTYDGLLKTTDNDVLDVSGVTLIEDGLGNASALSLGRANNGVTITGGLTTDDVNGLEIGLGSGTNSTSIAIGIDALVANTTGDNNTAIGRLSLSNNTTGTSNTAIGSGALIANTTAILNVAIGANSLNDVTSGSSNIGIGYNTGNILTTGSSNVYIGNNVQASASDSTNEIIIGATATGNGSNTATYGNSSILNHYFTAGNVHIDGAAYIGAAIVDSNGEAGENGQILSSTVTGTEWIDAPSSATPTLDQVTGAGETSSRNVVINGADLGTITNSSNTLFGDGALASHTTGSSNTAIGQNALTAYTGGSDNTAVGAGTLDAIISSGNLRNTAVGSNALGSGTLLVGNTSVGYEALLNISGQYNVALGLNAGKLRFGGNKTLGDNNVYIGANTDSAAADTDNEIVIGANATGNGSNSATYGNSSITKHFFTSGVVNITGGTLELASQAEIIGSSDNLKISADPDNVSGSSTIEFLVDGNEKMRIDNSGNVGIGESSPDRKLHITDTSAGNVTYPIRVQNDGTTTGTDVGILFTTKTSGGGSATCVIRSESEDASGNNSLVFTTPSGGSTAERMRITSSGRVGIGCTPAYKLEINHTGADVNALVINDKSTPASTTGLYMRTTTEGRISVGSNAAMTFYNGGSSGTERMRIDSSGRVGIGTSSPTSKLVVSDTDSTIAIAASNTSGIAQLSLKPIGSDGSSVGDALIKGVPEGSDQATAMTFTTRATGGARTERMRIDSSGNVIIKNDSTTTSSPTLRLDANPKASWVVGDIIGELDFYTSDESGNAPYSTAFIQSQNETGAGTLPSGSLVFGTATYNAVGGAVERMRITSTGAVFMPYLAGSSGYNDLAYNTANGQLIYRTSSLRYKENVQDLPSALDKVNNLRTVTYDEKETGRSYFGLIAEELYEHIPELVTMKEIDGFDEPQPDGITYSMLSVYLLKAMQEQQEIINDLKARIETLENK